MTEDEGGYGEAAIHYRLHPADIFPLFVAIDLETTGLNPQECEIIELGAVLFREGQPTAQFSQLVKPTIPSLPEEIVTLTGIRDEDLQDAPRIADVVSSFLEFVGEAPVVGQNIGFDLGFLTQTPGLAMHFSPTRLLGQVHDTKLLARFLYPCLPSYSLAHLTKLFSLKVQPRHRACDDAWATGELFLTLVKDLLGVPESEIGEALHILSGVNSYLRNTLKAVLEARIKDYSPSQYTAPDPFFGSNAGGSPVYKQRGIPLEESKEDESLSQKVRAIFTNRVHLSQVIPNYEERPQQQQMGEEVAEVLQRGGVLLVEAGTGVGKSLAYLIPALLSGRPVAISSFTKTLQDQLFFQEIPRLGRLLPFRFTAVLLKGRQNYLCLTRWKEAIEHSDLFRLGVREKLACLVRWVRATQSGDLSEVGSFAGDEEEGSGVLGLICSQKGFCTGRLCSRGDFACPYYRLRQVVMSADLVVVNHSLALSHFFHLIDSPLGRFRHWIIDEAHRWEWAATQTLSTEFSLMLVQYPLERLTRLLRPRGEVGGLLLQWGEENRAMQASEIARKSEEVLNLTRQFFASLIQSLNLSPLISQPYPVTLRYSADEALGAFIIAEAQPVEDKFEEVVKGLSELKDFLQGEERAHDLPAIAEFISLLEEVHQVHQALIFSLSAYGEDRVCWLEVAGNQTPSVSLKTAPVMVSSTLAKHFFDSVEASILTSATLSTGGESGFEYIVSRLGLREMTQHHYYTAHFDSPFDFDKNCLVILPRYLPDPSQKDRSFETRLAEIVSLISQLTDRSIMVLFTSYQSLYSTWEALRPLLGARISDVYLQRRKGGGGLLVDHFRQRPGSILMGAEALWEGIDLPGKSLEVLIIAKLPFDVPDDPLVSARIELMRKEGGDPFNTFQVPRAVLKMRQGAGRLIRSYQDRGIILIADSRILRKNYGVAFQNAIPGKKAIINSPDELPELINTFFSEGAAV